jgi:hypothetical protein
MAFGSDACLWWLYFLKYVGILLRFRKNHQQGY